MKIRKFPEQINKKEILDDYSSRLLECMKAGMRSSFDIVVTPEGDSSWYKYLHINLEKGVKYIIFEDKDNIRGYLVWQTHYNDIHIYDLVINPNYQRDGVTLRNLLETFVKDIADKGFKNLIAYTNLKNDRMNKLLIKQGFTVSQKKTRGTVYTVDINKLIDKFIRKSRRHNGI